MEDPFATPHSFRRDSWSFAGFLWAPRVLWSLVTGFSLSFRQEKEKGITHKDRVSGLDLLLGRPGPKSCDVPAILLFLKKRTLWHRGSGANQSYKSIFCRLWTRQEFRVKEFPYYGLELAPQSLLEEIFQGISREIRKFCVKGIYIYIYIYIYGSRDICCPHFAQKMPISPVL